jgi:predicted glycoside hydrolase/deacetylase ChbG (UPF0249 family)/methylase of polypeptide subunit release factors
VEVEADAAVVVRTRDASDAALAPRAAWRGPAGARRAVILEADDLGLLYAFNEGIRSAYRTGSLTSTCLRANGYAYEHALSEVLPSCPKLGVGVHLCLNEAAPVASPKRVPALLDGAGNLRPGYLWLMRLARTGEGIRQIEVELRAQIEKVAADGVSIDHVNSHQHVHMIPAIFRLTCRLAREYGIRCVRLVRELPYWAGGLRRQWLPYVNTNYVKHLLLNHLARRAELALRGAELHTTDYFVGVRYTARMDVPMVVGGLAAAGPGSVEVLLHPAIGPDARDARYPNPGVERYARSPHRSIELRSLRSRRLAQFLGQEGCMATNFAALADLHDVQRIPTRRPEIEAADRALCRSVELACPPWVSAAAEDSRAFAELLLALTRPGQRVLDVGTGTGILAICLARAGRCAHAVDIAPLAVRTARANAHRNAARVDIRASDLLAAVEGRFDLIAFNPPYGFGPDNVVTSVAKHVLRQVPWVRRSSGTIMPRTVLKYHQELIARLVREAREHLAPGGAILIHAYLSEVRPLCSVLPASASVELLEHDGLAANRTVGMLVRPGE